SAGPHFAERGGERTKRERIMYRMVISWHSAFRGWAEEVKWFASEEEAKEWWVENRAGYGRGATRRIERKEPAAEGSAPEQSPFPLTRAHGWGCPGQARSDIRARLLAWCEGPQHTAAAGR